MIEEAVVEMAILLLEEDMPLEVVVFSGTLGVEPLLPSSVPSSEVRPSSGSSAISLSSEGPMSESSSG